MYLTNMFTKFRLSCTRNRNPREFKTYFDRLKMIQRIDAFRVCVASSNSDSCKADNKSSVLYLPTNR